MKRCSLGSYHHVSSSALASFINTPIPELFELGAFRSSYRNNGWKSRVNFDLVRFRRIFWSRTQREFLKLLYFLNQDKDLKLMMSPSKHPIAFRTIYCLQNNLLSYCLQKQPIVFRTIGSIVLRRSYLSQDLSKTQRRPTYHSNQLFTLKLIDMISGSHIWQEKIDISDHWSLIRVISVRRIDFHRIIFMAFGSGPLVY
jgi:hypothetical protein